MQTVSRERPFVHSHPRSPSTSGDHGESRRRVRGLLETPNPGCTFEGVLAFSIRLTDGGGPTKICQVGISVSSGRWREALAWDITRVYACSQSFFDRPQITVCRGYGAVPEHVRVSSAHSFPEAWREMKFLGTSQITVPRTQNGGKSDRAEGFISSEIAGVPPTVNFIPLCVFPYHRSYS